MMPLVTHRRISASGLFFALLALTAQLAFGAVVPRPEIALVLQGNGAICHAPPPPGTPAQPIHPHNNPDALLCPLCAALATPGIVLPGTGLAPLAPPQVATFRGPDLPPPATAPPTPVLLSAQPRGPPLLA